MSNLTQITFESAYRQLPQSDRAFVDSFVARIELTADTTGQSLQDCLAGIDTGNLPARDLEHLSSALVRSAISERIKDLTEAQNISPRRLIKRAAALAFASLDDFYDPDADRFKFQIGTPEQRATVKKYKITESVRNGTVTTEIELKDDVKMLIALMTKQGLLDRDGEPINPEIWRDAGAIKDDTTLEELADQYRLVSETEQ